MRKLFFLLLMICFFVSNAQVDLGGYIQPFNASSFPTHKDSLGKGGYVVVKDTAQRNSITCLRRKYGMAVYVQNENKLYILKDSVCLNNWEEFAPSTGVATRIVSGNASFAPSVSNLSFQVTNCEYFILGRNFTTTATTITLDTSNSLPRFDVIALDTNRDVVIIKGTPGDNPIKPQVNPISQIELTFIYVNSNTSPAPTTLNQTMIYNEGDDPPSEWDIISSSGDPYDDKEHYLGLVSFFTSSTGGGAKFESPITISVDTVINITMWVKITSSTCEAKPCIAYKLVFLYNSNLVSSSLEIGSNYGLDFSDTSWQQVVVPFSDITFDNSFTVINGLSIKAVDGGDLNFDNTYLVTNGAGYNGSGGIKRIANSYADAGVPISIGTTTGSALNLISNNQTAATITSDRELIMQSIYDSSKKIILNSDKPYINIYKTEPPYYVGDEPHSMYSTYTQDRLQLSKSDYDTTLDTYIQTAAWLSLNGISYFKTLSNNWTLSFNNNSNGTVSVPNASGYLPLKVNDSLANSNGKITIPLIDSLKRSHDSVFAYKKGSWVFQYKDSVNGGGGGSGTVTSIGTGYGLSGGTITTSGTISVDSSSLSNKYLRIVDTSNKWVNQITRTIGKDSIIYYIDGNRYAIKDSVGTNPAPVGYYISSSDTSTQKATSNNVGHPMKFKLTDINNGITINGADTSRISISNTGVYNIQFSSQFENSDNAQHFVNIWLRKNGVDVPGTNGKIYFQQRKSVSEYAEIIIGWNYVVNAIGGDYYQIVWSTDDYVNVSMKYFSAGNPPPSASSVIVTVTQQSGIMAGTGMTALNGLSGDVQTFATGTSGTDFAISSSGTSHTFNMPIASSTNTGKLSSTDWSTFNSKISASDTSVFQRKSIASYSLMANNTNASANVTTQAFRDSSGTYSGTPTFTGTTAPSGTTNHSYRWVQVGKQVTVWVNLVYNTAGSAITACTIPFPSTLPTPASPTGISGANSILYTGSGSIQIDGTTIPSGSTFVSAIQINSSNNGYNIYVFRSSGSSINVKNIYATIQYYAQ